MDKLSYALGMSMATTSKAPASKRLTLKTLQMEWQPSTTVQNPK